MSVATIKTLASDAGLGMYNNLFFPAHDSIAVKRMPIAHDAKFVGATYRRDESYEILVNATRTCNDLFVDFMKGKKSWQAGWLLTGRRGWVGTGTFDGTWADGVNAILTLDARTIAASDTITFTKNTTAGTVEIGGIALTAADGVNTLVFGAGGTYVFNGGAPVAHAETTVTDIEFIGTYKDIEFSWTTYKFFDDWYAGNWAVKPSVNVSEIKALDSEDNPRVISRVILSLQDLVD